MSFHRSTNDARYIDSGSMLQTIIATLHTSQKFKDKTFLIINSKTNFYSKVDKPTVLKIDIKILKIRKSIIETFVVVSNNKNIKIATGNYKHFISSK